MARLKPDKPRGILNFRDAGSMPGVWRYYPSDDLAPFVEHYWTVEWDVPEPVLRETLPHPSIHLVLEGGREELAGIHTKKFSRLIAGRDRVFSAKFLPGGFRPFIDRPVSALSERVWDLADVLGSSARGLCRRALAHADHHATIATLEDFLRTFTPRADDSMRLAQRIAARVTRDRAITKVEHIVAAFGIGKRTLQRLFDDYVGVTPKWMIQRYRLIEAANRIHVADTPDWADVALGLGYADQAHFIRDFKKIVGQSPADYHAALSRLPRSHNIADSVEGNAPMMLSELLRAARRESGLLVAHVGDDWLQGRSAFGGLQGAFAVEAMRTLVDASFPLRTFQMTFVAPIGAGECTTRASVLRAGKNTMHVEARIVAGEETLAHAIGVFGRARESIVKRDMPPAPARKAGVPAPYIRNVMPNFFQHFDVVFLEGAAPFSGQPVHRNRYELGLKDASAATDAHLIALADFVPPVALSWMPQPTPGSSMTWMLELLDQGFPRQPLAGWLVDSEMLAARDGYTSQTTTLWSPAGVATVLSRQSMVVFG